jgi:hypothetical protein
VLIPTYAADGGRIHPRTPESIARLLSLSLIVVKRNRKGAICAAHFRPTDGANPLRATANMGQRYVYEQPVGNGYHAWTHRELIQRQDLEMLLGIKLDSREDVDLYLRGVFRAVPLSCMAAAGRKPQPPRTPAKVVSIEAGRKYIKSEIPRQRRAA